MITLSNDQSILQLNSFLQITLRAENCYNGRRTINISLHWLFDNNNHAKIPKSSMPQFRSKTFELMNYEVQTGQSIQKILLYSKWPNFQWFNKSLVIAGPSTDGYAAGNPGTHTGIIDNQGISHIMPLFKWANNLTDKSD